MAPLRIGILHGDDLRHEIVPAAVEISRAAAAHTEAMPRVPGVSDDDLLRMKASGVY